jgi:hypothetical protein
MEWWQYSHSPGHVVGTLATGQPERANCPDGYLSSMSIAPSGRLHGSGDRLLRSCRDIEGRSVGANDAGRRWPRVAHHTSNVPPPSVDDPLRDDSVLAESDDSVAAANKSQRPR